MLVTQLVKHCHGIYFKHVFKTICWNVLPELRMDLKLLGVWHFLKPFPESSLNWVSSQPTPPRSRDPAGIKGTRSLAKSELLHSECWSFGIKKHPSLSNLYLEIFSLTKNVGVIVGEQTQIVGNSTAIAHHIIAVCVSVLSWAQAQVQHGTRGPTEIQQRQRRRGMKHSWH